MALMNWAVLLTALLAISNADYHLNDIKRNEVATISDDTIHRLPEGIDPVHYEVEFTPYFEATGVKEAFSFDGIVTINVTVQEDNINVITLHENVKLVTGITVTDENGTPILLNEKLPFERQTQYQFLKIYLRDGITLVKGSNYVIRVTYIGHMNETPLSRGVFRGSYLDDNGERHWYAACHLQPTHSRQAFPSFDEPGFKSTFTIIINRLPSYVGKFSNMDVAESSQNGDRIRDVFHDTPRMSAYLISIHISEDFTVIAENNNQTSPYRIIARPNAAGQGERALDVGPPITEWLGDYLGISYYSMGTDNMKNDQIAVPDWASGATENWGLVSYRENRLLSEEGETNSYDKLIIGTITAHELAHKWFGNLVTCRWWDNVWINEGYASYFEYFAMDGVYPDLEIADQFITMYVHSALSSDASASTRALKHEVNTPSQVTGHFSGISYTKGATMLNMIKHLITEDTFKKGLNYFLEEMSYQHAFPEDVYRNFAKATEEDGVLSSFTDFNMTEFVRYWTEEVGYPLLNVQVNRNTGSMQLSQERFFISPQTEQNNNVWPIPLTYTTQSNPDWTNQRATNIMNSSSIEISSDLGDEWVIFNVKQNGMYRVNYDLDSWNLIATALKENRDSINAVNRGQVVDDVFALMRSGHLSYNDGFYILDYLREETSYFVWYPAITGFNWIRNRFLHMPDALAEFDALLHDYLEGVINDLGYHVVEDEALTRSLNRFFTFNFACNVGHQGCINDAVTKYNALVNEGTVVHPDIRRHVFCTGVRNGGYSEWQFLYNRYLASNNYADQVAMMRAMGCTSDQAAINQYMELIISDRVKAQDRVNGFTFIFMGNRENARAALPFFKERYEDIREAVTTSGNFGSVLSSMASYMDEEGLVEMEEWLNENQDTIPEYSSGLAGINSNRAMMEWGNDMAQEILSAARGSAVAITPLVASIFTTLVVLLR